MIHAEAYRLMQYQDGRDRDGPIEWLWNSRDGVTPFLIGKRNDGELHGATGSMKHINWQDDLLALQYVPNTGQRVFIDLTEPRARELLALRIQHQWDPPGSGFKAKKHYVTKKAMFDNLLPDAMEGIDRGVPDVIVCDTEMQREFVKQREHLRTVNIGDDDNGKT